MNKKQLLQHLQNDVYCRIGISKIHGVGVIAIRDIPKGTCIFNRSVDFKLIRFKENELNSLHQEVKKMIFDFFAKEEGGILIPTIGLNAIDISFFMNHSENPNVVWDKDDDFVAKKTVKKGEELTLDYKTISE